MYAYGNITDFLFLIAKSIYRQNNNVIMQQYIWQNQKMNQKVPLKVHLEDYLLDIDIKPNCQIKQIIQHLKQKQIIFHRVNSHDIWLTNEKNNKLQLHQLIQTMRPNPKGFRQLYIHWQQQSIQNQYPSADRDRNGNGNEKKLKNYQFKTTEDFKKACLYLFENRIKDVEILYRNGRIALQVYRLFEEIGKQYHQYATNKEKQLEHKKMQLKNCQKQIATINYLLSQINDKQKYSNDLQKLKNFITAQTFKNLNKIIDEVAVKMQNKQQQQLESKLKIQQIIKQEEKEQKSKIPSKILQMKQFKSQSNSYWNQALKLIQSFQYLIPQSIYPIFTSLNPLQSNSPDFSEVIQSCSCPYLLLLFAFNHNIFGLFTQKILLAQTQPANSLSNFESSEGFLFNLTCSVIATPKKGLCAYRNQDDNLIIGKNAVKINTKNDIIKIKQKNWNEEFQVQMQQGSSGCDFWGNSKNGHEEKNNAEQIEVKDGQFRENGQQNIMKEPGDVKNFKKNKNEKFTKIQGKIDGLELMAVYFQKLN